MLPTDIADHRSSRTSALLEAIAEGDPLALAEAYHRTCGAAHACATRLVGRREEVEALMRAAYLALWTQPPVDAPLEAWVRHRVFVEGRAHLRDQGRAAASPSTTLLLRDAPATEASLDRTERLVAGLDDDALRALLLAHDRGIPTADQRSEHADAALRRALYALAETEDPGGCHVPGLGDWVLGLLDDDAANSVAHACIADDCAEVARVLRRGRRRIEGLPPAPDLGHRVIAYVLSTSFGTSMAAVSPGGDEAPADVLGDDDVRGADGPPSSPSHLAPPDDPPGGVPESGSHAAHDVSDHGAVPPEPAATESALGGDTEVSAYAQADPYAGSALDTDIDADSAAHQEGLSTAVVDESHAEDTAEEPRPDGDIDRREDERGQEEPGRTTAPMDPIQAEADSADDQPRWSRPAPAAPASESVTFEGDGFSGESEPGRRALTITLTVLGALLLLAAGAVAGLLAIRVFLG